MNRLLVAALAACLAQFALGCSVDRTEIYEPAPAPAPADKEFIDKYQVADNAPSLNYPVPTDVAVPLDRDMAKVENDHRDLLNPHIKFAEVLPPAVDIALIPPLPNVDGVIIPTLDIDPNEMVPGQPSLGLAPFLAIDPLPSHGNASAIPPPW